MQLLKYMVKIWEQKTKENKTGDLSVIIPLLIYQGEHKWAGESTFSNLFAGLEFMPDKIRRYIPDYEYVVYDFSPDSGQDIKGGVILRIYLDMIRAVSLKDPAYFVQVYIKSLLILQRKVGFEKAFRFMEALTRYLLSARGDIDFEEVKRELQAKSLEGSELLMTIAERLIKEGMEKGKKEGMEKGKKEGMEIVAKNMLKDGESLDKIIRYTGLTKEEVEKLKKEQ